MGASANTMSLSWLPPEKPNGIILDYEIKYHEKVRASVSQWSERHSITIPPLSSSALYIIVHPDNSINPSSLSLSYPNTLLPNSFLDSSPSFERWYREAVGAWQGWRQEDLHRGEERARHICSVFDVLYWQIKLELPDALFWVLAGFIWLVLSLFPQDQGEAIAHTMTAQRSSARIEGLKPGTSYVVQVRARTVAGYGRYSSPTDFSTNHQSM